MWHPAATPLRNALWWKATPSIAAKELVEKGCTAIELCAGFGNEGIARIKRAVGPGIAVGAVKFDFHPAFGFKSGDEMFG